MKTGLRTAIIILCVLRFGAIAVGASEQYAIRAGKILTVTRGTINHGIILIDDGQIKAVGKSPNVTIPKEYQIIDASDKIDYILSVRIYQHLKTNCEGVCDEI